MECLYKEINIKSVQAIENIRIQYWEMQKNFR